MGFVEEWTRPRALIVILMMANFMEGFAPCPYKKEEEDHVILVPAQERRSQDVFVLELFAGRGDPGQRLY